jgi:methionyl-tRNA formyltransferase
LRADALELVPQGWFNLHFSLLPAYRGAAPVQRALIAGDTESGVTVFQIDAGMDTGAIVAQLPVPIHDDDDAGTLLDRLAEIGAKVLVDSFGNLEHGSAQLTPQVGEVSLAPKIERSESQLNWAQPASKLTNLVRGLTPNPGAFTTVAGNRLGILPFATPAAHVAVPTLLPGEIFATKKEVLVGTGTSAVQLGLVQPPGKKPMPAIDWMRGARLSEGTRLQ